MTGKESKNTGKKTPIRCPYCDRELQDNEAEQCIFCRFKIDHCRICSYPVSDKMEKCPNCGTKL